MRMEMGEREGCRAAKGNFGSLVLYMCGRKQTGALRQLFLVDLAKEKSRYVCLVEDLQGEQ